MKLKKVLIVILIMVLINAAMAVTELLFSVKIPGFFGGILLPISAMFYLILTYKRKP